MNFGVIGFGSVARKRFLPAMTSSGGKITALLLPKDEYNDMAIRELSSSLKCSVTTSAYDFFQLPMEAVYIASPPSTHHGYAFHALGAGKHVLCEKPLGNLPGSVNVLVQVARKGRLVLMENFPCFHHPQWTWTSRVFKEDHVYFLSMIFGGPIIPKS